MRAALARWSLILLCFSMAAAVGGGLYEHIILTPLWSKSPPSSFSIIQAATGVPLQAITLFVISSLALSLTLCPQVTYPPDHGCNDTRLGEAQEGALHG